MQLDFKSGDFELQLARQKLTSSHVKRAFSNLMILFAFSFVFAILFAFKRLQSWDYFAKI